MEQELAQEHRPLYEESFDFAGYWLFSAIFGHFLFCSPS
jgi:hypothetical protein